jgi:NADPH-dependent 2,4-dienoyl-CoA reductase/sulfur reductase-like enzyme/rhodanese-related sulfurtransferase
MKFILLSTRRILPSTRRIMSTSTKEIVIVGGVAGGMSCATRLRRLDEHANIVVIEKGPYISYANCGIPYALGSVIDSEAKLHVQTPEKMRSWFNVDVRTGTELLSVDRAAKAITVRQSSQVKSLKYDKLVLALGAEPLTPPIDGVGANHIFHLATIPDLQHIQAHIAAHKVGAAVVIGGAFIGLEAAENLRGLGLDVTVVERFPHLFPLADADMAYPLEQELISHGVNVITDATVFRITAPSGAESGLVYISGHEPVRADLVIVAVGVRARTSIAAAAGLAVGPTGVCVNEFMQTSDPDVYAVGDMTETYHRVLGARVQLALAGPANRQGRLAADHISGRTTAYRGNIGTSVCKVFGQAIGLVGLSAAQLDVAGFRHESVTVHPPHHAAYYPDAQKLVVRLHFELCTGRLLGAQVTGRAGVDKQIDVLAVAVAARMMAEDLEHLELAYAPPFGAAKAAVNMAGFVAANVVRGDVQIIHAVDFATGRLSLPDYQVLDVRSADEFAAGHIAGAINIPLGELRRRLGELDKSAKVLAYCFVGYRGYLAYRILKQEEFEVVNLDGGFRSVVEGGFDKHLQRVSSGSG